MKKNKKIITSVIALIFIAICNIPFVSHFIDIGIQPKYYRFSNNDGSFTSQSSEISLFSATFDGLENNFRFFLDEYPDSKGNDTLYRLFTKNPLYFWRWSSFYTKKEFQVPYKNWDQIEQNRVPYDSNSRWQKF